MPFSKATLADEEHMFLLLAQAQRTIDLKSNETYRCGWLISGEIGSSVWETKDPGSSKIRIIDFNVTLIDGTCLSDPDNLVSLVTIQKLAYHLRMGRITNRPIAPNRWQEYIGFSINLLNRLLLNDDHFQTKDHGFMLLTKDDCMDLMHDFSKGGWSSALRHKERLIDYLHSSLNSPISLQVLLDDPDNLDQAFLNHVQEWLHSRGLYVKSQRKGKQVIKLSRVFLNTVLHIPKSGMSESLDAFIKQFEPASYAMTSYGHRQHRSQNQPLTTEVKHNRIGEKHFGTITAMLKCLLSGHKVLPEIIPPIELPEEAIHAEFGANTEQAGHTNLIPLSIGLDALSEATKWILYFGPAIVQITIGLSAAAVEIKTNVSPKHWGRNLTREFNLLNQSIRCINPETRAPAHLTDVIDVAKLTYRSNRKVAVTANDFKHVIQSYIGACALVISILKPIRDTELHGLRRDCLDKETSSGGVSLQHEQMKAGMLGINPQISQAIPSITARAIQQLQVMGGQLAEIFEDKSDSANLLFYYPSQGYGLPPSKTMSFRVNTCLDRFCDMIETPIDAHGRRWYLRIHEMRKFFLFIMHRHEGDRVTEILRRAAGHKDRNHIESYTAENDVDDEVVRYTSECIEDRLIALNNRLVDQESNQGLAALYNHACQHFGVSSISGMKYDELIALLSEMRLTGRYEISTYTVELKEYDRPVTSVEVAVKFGEIKDEKFNR